MPTQPPRNVNELVAVLDSGDDSAIVGLHESTWFDAKSNAYQLDNPKQVWELAKDVSAMANVKGGLILIGARTERAEGSLVEFVTAVLPIPTERLMMADRVHDLLRERLWPPLGSRVRVRQFDRDGGRSLQAIVVEEAAEDCKPILVRSRATIEIDGATHELDAWGSARRAGSGTEWEPIQQLWADIRDGRVARRNLTLPVAPVNRLVDERLTDAAALLGERIGLGDHAAITLAAYPERPVRLPGFHRHDGIRGALEQLPERAVRPNGFGLGYGLSVDSLNGGLAEVETGRRGLLVEQGGLIVAIALGTSEMLGWAHETWRPGEPLRVNRFVVVEWPLEFTRFVSRELMSALPGSTWTYDVRGVRLRSGQPPLEVSLSEFPFGFAQTAVVDAPDERIDATDDPQADAFEIVDHIVSWFGLDEVRHPWIADGKVSERLIRGDDRSS